MVKNILEAFAALPDPRWNHPNKLHKLIDIVVMAVCGTIAKCDGWEEIEEYGERKEAFLRGFLELPNGIPSHDTFNRVFAILDPLAWQSCFMKWMQGMSQLSANKLVNIDGKTLRASKSSGTGKVEKEQAALEIVSAWVSENELVLAQLAVPENSNEITVIPELLELLDLQGATVTIDAIGCQTEIASTIIEQGGEYILGLKKNQETLFNAVTDLFEDNQAQGVLADQAQTVDVAHGRQETRTCYVLPVTQHLEHFKLAGCDLSAWAKLTSVFMVERHTLPDGKETSEKRFFLSSLASAASEAIGKVRQHWSIENQQHYPLDVTFNEDSNRTRKGFAPQNLAALRRLALNLLNNDPTPKLSKSRKRLKALLDDHSMLKLLGLSPSH
jgi:predicted transposase YbfD/YdcC